MSNTKLEGTELKTFLSLLLIPTFLTASDCCYFPLPNTLSMGPEFYQVHRKREGGTVQNGWISGGRAIYDRICASDFYWGANALYGIGPLKGHTGKGAELKSTFKDYQIEGRFGFTFLMEEQPASYLTPYIGLGYRKEDNSYREPSPLILDFKTRYPYAAIGFLSGLYVDPQIFVGLTFKAEVMYDARCVVTGDPDLPRFTLQIRDERNYRVELPMIYRFCPSRAGFEAQVTPFYESRHYGGREGYPSDFIDTRLMIWGFNLLMNYRF